MSEMVEAPLLPDGTKEVAGFADLTAAWLTLQRADDGTVYLVSWWYGTPKVIAIVNPDGSSQTVDTE